MLFCDKIEDISISIMGHNANANAKALSKWRELIRAYGLRDVAGSQHSEVYSPLKEHLFKEDANEKHSTGNGAVFGRQLPNGRWLHHSLSSTQRSRLRDKLQSKEVAKLNFDFKQVSLTLTRTHLLLAPFVF